MVSLNCLKQMQYQNANKEGCHRKAKYAQFTPLLNTLLLVYNHDNRIKCTKIVSEYDQEIPQSITNCRQTRGIVSKNHTTITRHQEDKQSKAASSLFPVEMIAKLEWTQSNAQQNIEQVQNPTIGVTINNELTTTEPSP